MLTALIRKDIRICRLPIVAGVVLLVAPFGMAAVIVSSMPLWTEAAPASAWAVLLGTGCYFSVMCSQPTLAMISGSIIAAERGDRSAEFLAYLPPSKFQILGSKFIVLVLAALVVYGVNFSIGLFADWLSDGTNASRNMTSDLVPWRYLAAIGVAAVGAGWCASAMSGSAGPAVAMAFLAPLVVLGGLAAVQYMTDWPSSLAFAPIYFSGCTISGAILFSTGSVYFLCRVEP